MKKLSTALALAGLATTGVVALSAGPASASGGNDVRVSGSCSTSGTWKLKVKDEDGGLEVEFEVDTNVAGQAFRWNIKDNGRRVAFGTDTTAAPSGSFSVERLVADRPGTDTVVFRAARGGNVCTGSIAY